MTHKNTVQWVLLAILQYTPPALQYTLHCGPCALGVTSFALGQGCYLYFKNMDFYRGLPKPREWSIVLGMWKIRIAYTAV